MSVHRQRVLHGGIARGKNGIWSKELEKKPKLAMLRKIVECGQESSCADLKSKRERGRVMLKLRGVQQRFKWRQAGGEERG